MMASQGNTAQRRANEAAVAEVLRRELRTALDSVEGKLLQQSTETRDTLLQQEAETREVLLQKEAEHHAAVLAKLDGIQTTLNALANGSIQLGIQGMAFFGNPIAAAVNPVANHVNIGPPTRAAARTATQAAPSAPAPAPAPASLSNNLFDSSPPINASADANAERTINGAMDVTPAVNPLEPGPPPRSRNPRSSRVPPPGSPGGPPDYVLARVSTVPDTWKEWKTGINGGPAVEELERVWGGAWRPTGKSRVAFCRRKVIWDEVARLMRAGLSAEEACESLESLRDGRSLLDLGKAIKTRQKGRRSVGLDLPDVDGMSGSLF